jgi:hypothetical protein
VGGVDLSIKLRNALGKGKIVPVEELIKWMTPFDEDKDGELTRPELAAFFHKYRVGGQWFAQVVAKTIWGFVQTKLAKEVSTIRMEYIARIINMVMKRAPRPEKRYEISPEAMVGYAPIKPLTKQRDRALGPPPAPSSGPGTPRATPRGPAVAPQRNTSQTPGRTGSPQASAGAQARPAMRRPAPRRPGPRR